MSGHGRAAAPAGVSQAFVGKLRAHRREDFLTKVIALDYDPGAKAPRVEALVEWAMLGRTSLVSYLRRAAGYSAAGSNREQCLLFAYGEGDNGKTTVLRALMDTLGHYAVEAMPDLLTAAQGERHSTETPTPGRGAARAVGGGASSFLSDRFNVDRVALTVCTCVTAEPKLHLGTSGGRMSSWKDRALGKLQEIEPETRLWTAVLIAALRDLQRPPTSPEHRGAREALEDETNVRLLADLAGADVATVRRVARALLAGWRPPTTREWDRRRGPGLEDGLDMEADL